LDDYDIGINNYYYESSPDLCGGWVHIASSCSFSNYVNYDVVTFGKSGAITTTESWVSDLDHVENQYGNYDEMP
jgi:hypothetical protein